MMLPLISKHTRCLNGDAEACAKVEAERQWCLENADLCYGDGLLVLVAAGVFMLTVLAIALAIVDDRA